MKKFYIIGENNRLTDEINKLSGKGFSMSKELNKSVDIVFETTNYNKDIKFNNLTTIEDAVSGNTLIVSTSTCVTLLEQSVYMKHPQRIIGAGLYPTFSETGGIELTKTHLTDEGMFDRAASFFNTVNLKPYTVTDRPGLVFLRIVSLIINEAYQVWQEGTADAKDIDTAMKLGTNYPYGPIEWSERIGIDLIYNLLSCMYGFYGDDRYRITPLLREKYLSGLV